MNPPRHTETPELLAPAGDWECIRAAVANGADAVYFGLPRFNARLRAHNFTEAELPEVVAFCHRHGVKAYVAFNTLVFTGEMPDAAEYLRLLSRAGVDALIVQDVGLIRLAREIVPELPIHASTQMTITSPEGVEFAHDLGIERAVLARELSLRELEKFRAAPDSEFRTPNSALPLEVFVHGALCVAYSGQCLTSESLGQRSANRGECAQACRMPYELVVDGAVRDLGDKRYLLSPQDLAAVNEIPALIEAGVISFKIEGRLKSPEYVSAVCQVYRKAIDAALAEREFRPSAADRYQLEMTFSRGLYSGWMHGVNHQELVSARFGKKRGAFAGRIARIGRDFVEFAPQVPLKAGDGVVFDTGGDTNAEQGGRIFQVKGQRLFFQHDHIDFSRLKAGDRVWKTDDPELDKRLRQSFTGRIESRHRERVDLAVSGRTGEPLTLRSGAITVQSTMPLQTARTAPLTLEKLREHLGRLGDSVYELGELHSEIDGEVILPIGELNRLRRELVFQLDAAHAVSRREEATSVESIVARECRAATGPREEATLRVLCRSMEQLDAALENNVAEVYVDFEDIRRGKDAVARVRQAANGTRIFLATPRIQKAGEQGFFKLIENAAPDGVLIRNLGAIAHFAGGPLPLVGDFSLNVANPLTAAHFIGKGLQRVTVSYDLNIEQVLDLLQAAPPAWFELTIHQHMPMFHMEHCVFAGFLSKGKSFLDCGRPCEKHRVHLRDRVGMEHPLRADVGCRNTLFNAVPQTGARFFEQLAAAGLRDYRIELLEEDFEQSRRVIRAYQELLSGEQRGEDLSRTLQAQSQLGVTRGTFENRGA
ncbi:putative protease [Chthoniobacter flavus]|uniref:U32 family peptidase n=1 Tax=Chthoniobacter flavus TaxID=191863 RepID=UPI0002E45410|nr:U32 family peptidase [Chthoniobacter flavus]TCO90101.1 putative protease [Chthoniobacter flavus]